MQRFQVWLVNLDPTVGSEMRKTRPAIIVSPDVLNRQLQTVMVAPLTTGRAYPFRVPTLLNGTPGVVALDQLRTVDKSRLAKHLDTLDDPTATLLLTALAAMFAP